MVEGIIKMNKAPLIVAIIWFAVAAGWGVMLIKDLLAGGGSATVMFGLVTVVSLFAGFTNLRRYRNLKK